MRLVLNPRLDRSRGVLAILAVLMAMTIALATLPSSASAYQWTNNWCSNVNLQPFGHHGDRCDMGPGYAYHYGQFSVINWTRSGCVRVIGYYGEPISSWSCGPGSYGTAATSVPNTPGFYRGSLRNNNLNSVGEFSGKAVCCQSFF